MEKRYYVYAYIRLDYNTYFYIGKGTGKRVKEHCSGRTKHFKNILNKINCAYEILYDNLTEEEALALEIETIEDLVFNEGYSIEFDTKHNKEKHLVNCTYGGEGLSGYKFTEEQRKHCSKPGPLNSMYGRTGELSPHYGKTYSNEHKDKIREANPKRKNVYCVELNRHFKSYREAAKILLEEYGIKCSHASISNVCRGKSHHAGVYIETNEPAMLHFEEIN